MTVNVDKVRATPFVTDPVQGRGKVGGDGIKSVQVVEKGLIVTTTQGEQHVPLDLVATWSFSDANVVIGLKEGPPIEFRAARVDVDKLRRQFNLCRIKAYLKNGDADVRLKQCPHCELLFPVCDESEVEYCPECRSMSSRGESLCVHKGFHYNFADTGLFSLVGPDTRHRGRYPEPGEAGAFASFRSSVQPLFQKLFSHTVWFVIWLSIWSVLSWVFKWRRYANVDPLPFAAKALLTIQSVCLILIFASLIMAGSYMAILTFRKAFKAVYSRSQWNRVIWNIQHGELAAAEKEIEKGGLTRHPGMLANMALANFHLRNFEEARDYLSKAIELCPYHPAFYRLAMHYDTDKKWEEQLAKIEALNNYHPKS